MSEIKTLRENVSELKAQHVVTEKKMDRILFLLDNDEGTGQKGLVAQVQDIKKHHPAAIQEVDIKVNSFITEYKKDQAVKKGKLSLLATIFGALGAFLTFISKYVWELFHK